MKTVKVCAEINTASGDIIWKHADGSKWLSQKKPELTETDAVSYTHLDVYKRQDRGCKDLRKP